MKVVQVEIPDQLAKEMEASVGAGWFTNEAEIARLVLVEFIRHHRFELLEWFQRRMLRGLWGRSESWVFKL